MTNQTFYISRDNKIFIELNSLELTEFGKTDIKKYNSLKDLENDGYKVVLINDKELSPRKTEKRESLTSYNIDEINKTIKKLKKRGYCNFGIDLETIGLYREDGSEIVLCMDIFETPEEVLSRLTTKIFKLMKKQK